MAYIFDGRKIPGGSQVKLSEVQQYIQIQKQLGYNTLQVQNGLMDMGFPRKVAREFVKNYWHLGDINNTIIRRRI